MKLVGGILTFFGACLLAVAVRFLILSLAYRSKSKTVSGRAYLDQTTYKRRMHARTRSGNLILRQTTATYSYTVDGKKYTIDETFDNAKPHELPRSVKVIYQTGHPNRAYLEKLTVPKEPVVCGVTAFLALILLANGIGFMHW